MDIVKSFNKYWLLLIIKIRVSILGQGIKNKQDSNSCQLNVKITRGEKRTFSFFCLRDSVDVAV